MEAEYEIVKNTKAKSDIWKHFGLCKRKSDGTIITNTAVCKICTSKIKYSGGTSNLISHVRLYHPGTSLPTDLKISGLNVTSSSATADRPTQQTLTNVLATKYKPSSPKASKITNAIANFIIKDLRPYRVVDSPEFRKMLSTLDPRYQCPSRKQFSEVVVPKKYAEVKLQVQSQLKNALQIAITTDGWTSRSTESYITITSSHINDEWEMANFVLQTRCMDESHTGENIAETLKDALKEWNIPETPLFLVSDNASNMVKAGALLNCDMHLGCYAHTLNLAAQKGLEVKSVSHILARVRKIVTFFHRSTVAAAVLKTQSTLLELQYHKLVIDVCTRWNSAYDMLERYLSMQAAVVGVLMSKELKSKDKTLKFLSDDDITLAEEVVKCLQPLKSVTTMLCSETVPTASVIQPLHHQLLSHFLNPKEGDSGVIVQMKKQIAGDLKTRYSGKIQTLLTKITSLDPRFKMLPFLSEQECLDVFNGLVIDAGTINMKHIVKIKTEPVDTAVTENPPLPSVSISDSLASVGDITEPAICDTKCNTNLKSGSSSCSINDLLGDVYVTKVESATLPKLTQLQQAEMEVATYKSCPPIPLVENPLQWWKSNEDRFPLLSKVAKKFLCIPATSVPSERVFSTAGDIVTAQRANLKSKHVDMLIFLKKNMQC